MFESKMRGLNLLLLLRQKNRVSPNESPGIAIIPGIANASEVNISAMDGGASSQKISEEYPLPTVIDSSNGMVDYSEGISRMKGLLSVQSMKAKICFSPLQWEGEDHINLITAVAKSFTSLQHYESALKCCLLLEENFPDRVDNGIIHLKMAHCYSTLNRRELAIEFLDAIVVKSTGAQGAMYPLVPRDPREDRPHSGSRGFSDATFPFASLYVASKWLWFPLRLEILQLPSPTGGQNCSVSFGGGVLTAREENSALHPRKLEALRGSIWLLVEETLRTSRRAPEDVWSPRQAISRVLGPKLLGGPKVYFSWSSSLEEITLRS
ncbi:hypothetical protein Nepgr_020286 [Nepenthes gracilis]|uniref:Uncharacterized protein n=1 Tax=Nepenthes gracilis TaxID=150966 RepID=A0AAD3SWK1_NEPGR|nr:hypothetical protein Nepgr_020286 [Nepenthes gracilis]